MNVIERPRAATSGVGYLASAVIVAWVGFALIDRLEPNGRHLLVLGALRVVLFGALLAFAVKVGATTSRLGRSALAAAAAGAAVNLVGGVGAVLTDGLSYNPFATGASAPAPPWYVYLVLIGALLFALGTVLVGVAGRRGGWLAVAVILAGVLYVVAVPLGAYGHLVWIAAWFALALGLATGRDDGPVRERATVTGR